MFAVVNQRVLVTTTDRHEAQEEQSSRNRFSLRKTLDDYITPSSLYTTTMTIGDPNNEWQFGRRSFIKDWQFSITSDLRGDLVESVFHNIIKSILPANGNTVSTAVLSERRRVSLLQFAHKVEAEMFNRSESKEEYLNLISRKIASIRREFEERRLLRKIDNLASSRPTGGHSTSSTSSSGHTSSHHASAWIQALSVEYRLQIVKRILQVICPLEPRAVYDLRFLHWIKYVQKIEKEIYKVAKTKEEYYQLIADKTHKILVEMNHKRSRRQERPHKDHHHQLASVDGNSGDGRRTSSQQAIGESLASPPISSSINPPPVNPLINTPINPSIKTHMSSIRRVFELPVELNQ